MQSLCRELLQPKAGSTKSTLVLNTLPWERTEVISRTGPAGTETLGTSNVGVTLVSEFLTGAEAADKEIHASPCPGQGLLTCQITPWDFIRLQVVPELWMKKRRV